MNFQRLEYFSVLASYLSYSKAAKQLYISQPALSKQISVLEEELGIKLFKRTKRSVLLTKEGEICLSKTKNILYNYRDLLNWSESVQGSQYPSLRFGYYGLLMQDVVPVILQNLWKVHPTTEVSLRLQGINTLLSSLISGKLDASIITSTYYSHLPNINYQRICTIDYKLVVPSNHRLAGREIVHLEELKDEDFIIFSKENFPQTYSSTMTLCEKYNLKPRVTYECEDPLTLYLMIESGKCITVASSRRNALKAYNVKLIDLDCYSADLKKDILAIWNSDNDNPTIPFLLQAIETTFLSLGSDDGINMI